MILMIWLDTLGNVGKGVGDTVGSVGKGVGDTVGSVGKGVGKLVPMNDLTSP